MITSTRDFVAILKQGVHSILVRHVLIDHDTALRLAAIKGARDLIAIAKLAMPDTHFATDKRVKRAHALLKKLGAKA